MRSSARRRAPSGRVLGSERSAPKTAPRTPSGMPRSAAPARRAGRGRLFALRPGISDFYSTRRPASLSAILSRFRPREISFFRENMMPSQAILRARSRPSKAAFFFLDQNLAFTGVIGLSDDAFEFHPLHQRRGAVIADLEPALDVAGGGLAIALDDRHGLREQVAAAFAAHAGCIEYRAVLIGRLLRGDRFKVFGLALGLEMAHHLLDLLVGDERPVHAADASAAGHIEHVALSKQLLGA